MPRFSPAELKKLLRDYWLVGEVGEMADFVDKAVICYINHIPLALQYKHTADFPVSSTEEELVRLWSVYKEVESVPQIRNTLTALSISHTFHVLRPRVLSDLNPYPPLPSQPSRGYNVVMPAMHERLDDFEMLVPYYFQCIGRELNDQNSIKVKRIEGVFLLFLRHLLEVTSFTMADIIRGAIIEANENNGIVCVSDSLSRLFPPPHKTHRHFLTYFKELSSVVCMYSQTSFAITFIGTAAKNLAYHVRRRDNAVDEKVRECLEMRLRHRSETSIRKKLGFRSKDEYDAWLADNHIDIASKTHSNILEKWEQAQESLHRDQEISQPVKSSCEAEVMQHKLSDTVLETVVDTSGARNRMATAENSGKPTVVVHWNCNHIEINGKRESYPDHIVDAVAFMIEEQKEQQKSGKPLCFDRKELMKHLKEPSKKSVNDLLKARRYHPISDLVESLKSMNKFLFDVDMRTSKVVR